MFFDEESGPFFDDESENPEDRAREFAEMMGEPWRSRMLENLQRRQRELSSGLWQEVFALDDYIVNPQDELPEGLLALHSDSGALCALKIAGKQYVLTWSPVKTDEELYQDHEKLFRAGFVQYFRIQRAQPLAMIRYYAGEPGVVVVRDVPIGVSPEGMLWIGDKPVYQWCQRGRCK
ncbi:MAG: hypothetical protein Q8R13_03130 [bacterium]|nr:hypothetical protein [bacterium]MDZ4285200.1 hypothetical protein [Patescibacteria group bacterium]